MAKERVISDRTAGIRRAVVAIIVTIAVALTGVVALAEPAQASDVKKAIILRPTDAVGRLDTRNGSGPYFGHGNPPRIFTGGGSATWTADFAAPGGVPVYTKFQATGEVVMKVAKVADMCGSFGAGGLGVQVDVHVDGVWVGSVIYQHLANVSVRVDQWVSNGTQLGTVYSGGYTNCWQGTHVHIESRSVRGGTCWDADVENSATLGGFTRIGAMGDNVGNSRTCTGSDVELPVDAPPPTAIGGGKPVNVKGTGRCIDAAGAGVANGTKVQVWDCNGGPAQQLLAENGLLRIYGNYNMCLDANGGGAIHLWSCDGNNGNQHWTRYADDTIRWDGNGYCLDTVGDSYPNGAQLQLADCGQAGIPTWNDDGVFPRTPVAGGLQIQVAGTNKCIDAAGAGVANGTQVQSWDCVGNAAQTWRWDAGALRAYGNYTKCLDADIQGGLHAGSRVQVYDCVGSGNQKWSRTAAGTISSDADNALCLDTRGDTTNGAPLFLGDCSAAGIPTWTDNGALPLPALASAVPTVSGSTVVGQTLTAKPGTWTPGTSFTYQWSAGGSAIPGATKSKFTLTSAQAGTTVTVTVSGTKSGYAPASKTSAATAMVTGGVLTSAVPTVSGAAVVGQTLTAKAGTWTTGTALAYQWSAGGTPIPGATKSAFALTAAQAGKQITVTVTGSKSGFTTVSQISSPTSAVLIVLTSSVPTITGTPVVGRVLTASPGAWAGGTTFTYQWAAGGSAIPGATGSTLTLTSAQAAMTITVEVTGSKSGYTTVSKTSSATAMVTGGVLTSPVPTISGSAVVGETLTATAGTWTPGTTLSYQWSAGGAAIPGAIGPTLKLPSSLVGRTVAVTVTGSKTGFLTVSRKSAAKGPVLNVLVGGVPTITGNAVVGETLTVAPGEWTAGTKVVYQWSADGTPIPGATGTRLKLTSAQSGKSLTITVTGSLSGYATLSRTSAATSRVLSVLTSATPTITGAAVVGQTLTAVAGSWTPDAKLTYRWSAGGAAIPNATKSTLVLTSAQAGKDITVTVTGAKAGFTTETRTSVATGPVLSLLTSPVPTITGSAVVGQTLTAAAGSWTSGAVLTYLWSADGTAIPGAAGATLTLTSALAGKTVRVTVTGAKPGYAIASKISAPTAAVLRALSSAVPTIEGSAVVGQTLTAKAGPWTSGAALKYQWSAGGTPIPDATGATLTLTIDQAGKSIRVTVIGSKPGYTTVSTTSAATSTVPRLTLTPAPTPTITGALRAGSTLTADPGVWGPAPVALGYQWTRDDVAIPGATQPSYTTVPADAKASLRVQVTGTKTGYRTATKTSATVTVVAPSELQPGDGLTAGQFLQSPSGGFVLVMQPDGNLVEFETGGGSAVWSTGTSGSGVWAILQTDGNFVVYEGSTARWASGSNGGSTLLRLQDDGNLVLYDGGTAIWARGVAGWITVAARAMAGSTPGTQGMSAPTLNSALLRIYSPGTRLAVVCGVTNGQPVGGAATPGSSRSPVWHRLLNGDWVPDADFFTGVNGLFPGEPNC